VVRNYLNQRIGRLVIRSSSFYRRSFELLVAHPKNCGGIFHRLGHDRTARLWITPQLGFYKDQPAIDRYIEIV
jgi:hypothetical protein